MLYRTHGERKAEFACTADFNVCGVPLVCPVLEGLCRSKIIFFVWGSWVLGCQETDGQHFF